MDPLELERVTGSYELAGMSARTQIGPLLLTSEHLCIPYSVLLIEAGFFFLIK